MLKMWKKLKVPLLTVLVVGGVFSYFLWFQREVRFKSVKSAGWSTVFHEMLVTQEINRYDQKLKLRDPQPAEHVVIAKIDDASIEKFGRWPWSRSVWSQILDDLFAQGAALVAFDSVFSEPEFNDEAVTTSLSQHVAGNEQLKIRDALGLKDEQVTRLVDHLVDAGDNTFGATLRRYPQKVVLGYVWFNNDEVCNIYDPANPPAGMKPNEERKNFRRRFPNFLYLADYVDSLSNLTNQAVFVDHAPISQSGLGEYDPLLSAVVRCPLVNRSVVTSGAQFQGQFNANFDSDGLFRRLPLVKILAHDDIQHLPPGDLDFMDERIVKKVAVFPGLALQSVRAAVGPGEMKVSMGTDRSGRAVLKSVTLTPHLTGLSEVTIPTLDDGSIPINFLGTARSFPSFSLGNIIAGSEQTVERNSKENAKPLTGKIVFIGPTALGVYDIRPTPLEASNAGVYLHATVADKIIEKMQDPQSHLTIGFPALSIQITILWALLIGLAFVQSLTRSFWSFLATAAFGGVWLGFDQLAFSKWAMSFDSVTILWAMILMFTFVFAYRYFTEEKDRAFIKGAFEKYVSPDLVGSILEDPKKLNLGGQKSELTVLFSDIRGFTTISERMEAAELAKFMNDYLTPMTDVILENRGTIDKYMGDAIMAIFGAPVRYECHAQRAVDAALAMLVKLEELRVDWRAKNLPEIDIGIGINTGDMSVGNMGSTRIFSYTVMGDSVNLGSRLEGINKDYGTRLIVSEKTKSLLATAYLCRQLDRVKVKGKKQPVTIFEVVTKNPTQEQALKVQRFEAALALYYDQKFLEAKVLFLGLAPDDKTSAIYVRRCEQWLLTPPLDGWDGSWTMDHK